MRKITWGTALVALVLGGMSAPAAARDGVPHIVAGDEAGLGRGIGYAQAKDRLCELGMIFLGVRGELARHLGAGAAGENLASDVAARDLIDRGVVERIVAKAPPVGPSAKVRALVRGYVSGYNRYLVEGGTSECGGASWLVPIREIDIYRYMYQGGTDGLNRGLAGIVAATPPNRPDQPTATPAPPPERGSNAIATGPEATRGGGGLLLANPHVPWRGPASFWQARLTIPGTMDLDGVQMIGAPITATGYTRNTAWTGTVASTVTYSLFELKLVPGDPASYLVDGEPERMTERRVTVDVLGTPVTRSVWHTRYGPVLTSMSVNAWLGGQQRQDLPWTTERAYALADANAQTMRGPNAVAEFGTARTVEDIRRALRDHGGASTFNELAVDREGGILLAGYQGVPHVTDQHARTCNTELGHALWDSHRLPVLDGSRTRCALGTDKDSLVPGTFGNHRMPVRTAKDYLTNSNGSLWLSNRERPLTGLPRIFGDEGRAQTARSRMGLDLIRKRLDGGDGYGPAGFTVAGAWNLVLSNRSMTGELAAADTAAMCRSFPGGRARTSAGATVDVRRACAAVAAWDRRNDTTSRGALLFDRFWARVTKSGVNPWRTPFDPADPIGTPNTLDTADARIRTAFADAVAALDKEDIGPEAPLGEHQYVFHDNRRIPLHGGPDTAGVYNLLHTTKNPETGHPVVTDGTTFLMAVRFSGKRCPEVRTLLASGQSDRDAGQTRMFSGKRWLPGRLCDVDQARH
ncbi:penicillin acylase family protein [Nonomuraea typhae]|uniref:penicillin acylase family protein n=1 Tax=Nonomuraea typhae TaxID=2603600 RepID=UPI0012FB7B8A|nr:penicillin acylase family protein [Nonomuraea typhae]